MERYEEKKIYYTTNVIVDVTCDKCGISLANENDYVTEITKNDFYFIEGSGSLGNAGLEPDEIQLCYECAKPIVKLMQEIDKTIIG